MNEEARQRVEKEREALEQHCREKNIPIEVLRGELGETLDTVLLGLAYMQKAMDEAADFARQKDVRSAGLVLGAGAKRTKDDIYGAMMDAYGGPVEFMKRGMDGVPTIMKDYILAKYEGGVKRVALLLG